MTDSEYLVVRHEKWGFQKNAFKIWSAEAEWAERFETAAKRTGIFFTIPTIEQCF